MILAIETSVKTGSVSILNESQEIGYRLFSEAEAMSQSLLLGIENLIEETGFEKSDIKLVAVSIGPGSLTGIRVGISVGTGLAFALGIECVGVSLLEAMKLPVTQAAVISIVPAGRQQSYWQVFGFKAVAGKPPNLIRNDKIVELLETELQTTFVVEDSLFELLKNLSLAGQLVRCPKNLAGLIGKKAWKMVGQGESAKPSPHYIQETIF